MSFLHYYRGRGRYVNEEFDLDLTYITERIIGKGEGGRSVEVRVKGGREE